MIRFRRLTPALLNAWLVNQHLASTHARYRLRVWRENRAALAAIRDEMIAYHRVLAIGNTGIHIRALRTPPTPLAAGPAPPYQKNSSPVAQTDHEPESHVDGSIGKPSGFGCGQRSSGSVCSRDRDIERLREHGQEALRHTGSIMITSCSASSAGRYRHETNVEYRGPWRQTS
jgi:hypothetical protein